MFVQITRLTLNPDCDKMAAGDDDRDSAVRHLAFIMDNEYLWKSLARVCLGL